MKRAKGSRKIKIKERLEKPKHKYVNISKNEVVFNSFKKKQNYEKNKRVQKGKREEEFKKRRTESSRKHKNNKEIKDDSNMSLAYVV